MQDTVFVVLERAESPCNVEAYYCRDAPRITLLDTEVVLRSSWVTIDDRAPYPFLHHLSLPFSATLFSAT